MSPRIPIRLRIKCYPPYPFSLISLTRSERKKKGKKRSVEKKIYHSPRLHKSRARVGGGGGSGSIRGRNPRYGNLRRGGGGGFESPFRRRPVLMRGVIFWVQVVVVGLGVEVGMASPRNEGFLTQDQREKLRIAVQNAETLSLASPRSPTGAPPPRSCSSTSTARRRRGGCGQGRRRRWGWGWGEARAAVAFREDH